MSLTTHRIRIARRLSLAALGVGFLLYILMTYRWHWMNDAQVFHYAVFLFKHGFKPYVDVIDINMPGSYLSEYIGITLFGPTDLGWQLYDYSLLLALIGGCIVITAPVDWLCGVFAGVLFALIHAAEGAWQTAQRDEVMSIFLVWGYALIFWGVRRRRTLPWFFAGIAFMIACTFKPTAAGFLLLAAGFAIYHLRRESGEIAKPLIALTAGLTLVFAATVGWLHHYGAVRVFIEEVRTITAFYATLNPATPGYMLRHAFPIGLLVLGAFGLIIAYLRKSKIDWETAAIFSGMLMGLFSYFIQHKGYQYHRYPFIAFCLLWIALEIGHALRADRMQQKIALAALLIGSLGITSFYLYRVRTINKQDTLAMSLVQDLKAYDIDKLQHKVQCLDGITGCYEALFRLSWIQANGLMGDQLLFSSHQNAVSQAQRDWFLSQIKQSPPEIIILTNYWFDGPQRFELINTWPAFVQQLQQNYTLERERTFGPGPEPLGYRIYKYNHPSP